MKSLLENGWDSPDKVFKMCSVSGLFDFRGCCKLDYHVLRPGADSGFCPLASALRLCFFLMEIIVLNVLSYFCGLCLQNF